MHRREGEDDMAWWCGGAEEGLWCEDGAMALYGRLDSDGCAGWCRGRGARVLWLRRHRGGDRWCHGARDEHEERKAAHGLGLMEWLWCEVFGEGTELLLSVEIGGGAARIFIARCPRVPRGTVHP